MDDDEVLRLLEEIVVLREKRHARYLSVGGSVAADEVDLLEIAVLEAKLDLAREQERRERGE